jgi:hypothetical protein
MASTRVEPGKHECLKSLPGRALHRNQWLNHTSLLESGTAIDWSNLPVHERTRHCLSDFIKLEDDFFYLVMMV